MANVNFPTSSSQKVQSLFDIDDTPLADEGGFFVATNPTVGTAIAMTTSVVDDAATASSTHAQFAPAMLIYNPQNANNQNATSIYMRFLKLVVVQVPTSATAWKYSFRLDNVNRYSSGGSQITPVNPNTGSARANATALVYFGAIVPTALPSASARLVDAGTMDTAIPVAGDQYLFKFGNSAMTDQLNGGTTAKNQTINVPPIILAPGWCLALDMWGASNAAAASFEFTCGWVERNPGL
jgi:hypothetical protein